MFEREPGHPDREIRPKPNPTGVATPVPPEAAPQSNRPADNARQTDRASEASSEWRGNDGATDFLGLDQEVFGQAGASIGGIAMPPPHHASAQLPVLDEAAFAPKAAPTQDDNWLLDEAQAEPAQRDLDLDVPEPLDTSWSDTEAPKRRLGPVIVKSVAAMALVAVGLTLTKIFTTDPTPPARVTGPIEPTPGSRARRPELSLPGETAEPAKPPTATARPTPAEQGERETPARLKTPVVTGTPGEPLDRRAVEQIERVALDGTGEDSVAADVAPADSSATQAPDGAASEPRNDPTGVMMLPLARGWAEEGADVNGLRYATADDLAGVWEGSAIPLESVDAPSRIVTPQVGRVRAVLQTGEVFEGRLYGLGQGKVWLDTDLGRMALLASQVEKVEHILIPEGKPALGQPGSDQYAGLPRVRAKMPGGVFFGRVIQQEGDRVTLITEEGARITLEGAEIELAPTTKRVVVKGYVDQAGG